MKLESGSKSDRFSVCRKGRGRSRSRGSLWVGFSDGGELDLACDGLGYWRGQIFFFHY